MSGKGPLKYFEEILDIPRPSGQEEKMAGYLVTFAQKHNLEYYVDEYSNVIIKKKGTLPYICAPIILQAHIDMVCEKNSDKVFDFDKDAIVPVLQGEWLMADGTTLGADDGIGVATALAILDANDIEHGPIECLFTVDEETGLSGASALSPEALKSRILLNLDSEDEGEICGYPRETLRLCHYRIL